MFGVRLTVAVRTAVVEGELLEPPHRPLALDHRPGVSALKPVLTEHVAPMDGSAVAAQTPGTENEMSVTVAASAPPPSARAFQRSVIRRIDLISTSPV